MPTYSYHCTVCQHAFDIRQDFHDEALTVCPECQGRLRKVFSSVGVVFKGSGFYRTDSREPSTSTSSSTSTPSSTNAPDTAAAPAASSASVSSAPAGSKATSSPPSPQGSTSSGKPAPATAGV